MTPNAVPPKTLSHLIDAVVEHALRGAPPPTDLKPLIDWYETDADGYDALIAAWEDVNECFALKLYYLAWLKFSDGELLATCDIDGEPKNSDRIVYARDLIKNAMDEMEPSDCPSIHPVELTNKNGEHAILGWLMEVHGQGGPVPMFTGIFRDKNSFYQSLRQSDHVLSFDEYIVTDETILRLWEKPKRRRTSKRN